MDIELRTTLNKLESKTLLEGLMKLWDKKINQDQNGVVFAIERGILMIIDWEHNRVPTITIGLTESYGSELDKDFFSTDAPVSYGERTMLNLWDYIKVHDVDSEAYICDTDVLNWNIRVGAVRNVTELWNMAIRQGHHPSLIHPITFDEYFGYSNEMALILRVELNDYMS